MPSSSIFRSTELLNGTLCRLTGSITRRNTFRPLNSPGAEAMSVYHAGFSGMSKKFLLAIVFSLTSALAGSLYADSYGVLSNNASDNPPEVAPDPALRSSDPNRPPAYGPEDAPVLVVIFSDYKCPACRRANPATHQIASEFPGDVRIEVWQRPLAIHTGADRAARAALAAQRQGKFWEMHDLIFRDFGKNDQAHLEQHAMTLQLDMEQFRSDMADPAIQARIQREHDLAEALDARATPGWLINGKASVGWGSWNMFRNQVQREVAASKALVEQGLSAEEIREQRALENNTDSETFELYRTSVLLQDGAAAAEAGSR